MKLLFTICVLIFSNQLFSQMQFDEKIIEFKNFEVGYFQNGSIFINLNEQEFLETINQQLSKDSSFFEKITLLKKDLADKTYYYLNLSSTVDNRNMVIGLAIENNKVYLNTNDNRVGFTIFEGFSGCYPRLVEVDDSGAFLFKGRDIEMCVSPDYEMVFPCSSTQGFLD